MSATPQDVIDGRAKWAIAQGEVPACLDAIPSDSLDACVTDPPYHLTTVSRGGSPRVNDPETPFGRTRLGERGFMGKTWDGGDVAMRPETWAAILRVLKPGAHLLAFGGTRTYHRIACAIEDAGFEIRDTIAWMYGSGFPKSLDVSKAIDEAAGAERATVGVEDRRGKYDGAERASRVLNTGWRAAEGRDDVRDISDRTITTPATPAAAEWEGWGTALKPAFEPIIVARKPLVGTVAANVLRFGTGAINVDACRVGAESRPVMVRTSTVVAPTAMAGASTGATPNGEMTSVGRWPPNLLLSHAPGCVEAGTRRVKSIGATAHQSHHAVEGIAHGDTPHEHAGFRDADGLETVAAWRCVDGCPVRLLDEQSGELTSGIVTKTYSATLETSVALGAKRRNLSPDAVYSDTGTASRFFPQFDADPFMYCAKASRSEREAGLAHLPARTGAAAVERKEGTDGLKSPRAGAGRTAEGVRNFHPTVKPIALMRWLVRLVCRRDGIVLDPFMGSGTTGIACIEERVRFVGFDLEAPHVEIARGRIDHADKHLAPEQFDLFAGAAL